MVQIEFCGARLDLWGDQQRPPCSLVWPQKASSTRVSPSKAVSSRACKCPFPPKLSARPLAAFLAVARCVRARARSGPCAAASWVCMRPLPGRLVAAERDRDCAQSGHLVAARQAHTRSLSRPLAAPSRIHACPLSRHLVATRVLGSALSTPSPSIEPSRSAVSGTRHATPSALGSNASGSAVAAP
jgi:hypothetical protein